MRSFLQKLATGHEKCYASDNYYYYSYSYCRFDSNFETYWWIWLLLFIARWTAVIVFLALSDGVNMRLIESAVSNGQQLVHVGSNAGVIIVGGGAAPAPQTAAVATIAPCPSCSAQLVRRRMCEFGVWPA